MEVLIMGCSDNPLKTVTDFVGLTDFEGAEDARNQSAQSAAFSQRLTEEQLAFQREQYEDWKDIYGDLQENLGNYYKNLSPDDYISKGISAINREYEAANKAVTTQLAQRGISNSGIAAAAITDLERQGANARAGLRATAEEQVATDKMNFLGLGLGQGTQMLGINAQVSGTGTGAFAGLSGSQLSTSASLGSSSMDAMGSLVGGAMNYGLSGGGAPATSNASRGSATSFFKF
jgi:hypothetical protein